MKCPRCASIVDAEADALHAGPYRGAATPDAICARCGVVVLEGRALAARLETTHVQLTRSPLCRERKVVEAPCGNCGEARVQALHLQWDGGADVLIETCEACQVISTGRRGAPRLMRMLQQAEPMHRSLG